MASVGAPVFDDSLPRLARFAVTNLPQRALDLRQKMEQIRCDLASNVTHLSDDAKTLTDYRYYVRQHPWISLGAAAAVGLLLVPRKTKQQPMSTDPAVLEELLKKNQLVVQTKSEVNQKRGLIATGASLLAAAAMKAAMNYAQKKATERLINYAHAREQATRTPVSYPTHPR
jgi:hypothetical protein